MELPEKRKLSEQSTLLYFDRLLQQQQQQQRQKRPPAASELIGYRCQAMCIASQYCMLILLGFIVSLSLSLYNLYIYNVHILTCAVGVQKIIWEGRRG